MNNLSFFIGDPLVKVAEPRNWQQLQLELSFENGSPEAVLNSTTLEWVGPNAKIINDWFNSGLQNGPGIFSGVPLQIQICNTAEIVFNGIIDLTDPETIFNCDIVKGKIRDKRLDMFNDLIDSISFAYLATSPANGGPAAGAYSIIPKSINNGGDYIPVLYQRNDIPDGIAFFSAALMFYNLLTQIEKIISDLSALIAGLAAAASVVGLGAVALSVVEIIFYIIWIILELVLMFEVVKNAFNNLISPVMTKFGMYAKTLLEKACAYFGYGFSSTIFENGGPYAKLVILPAKQSWVVNENLVQAFFAGHHGANSNNRMNYDDAYNLSNGGNAYGYYDGTPGDLIRGLEDMFNAKAKIIFDTAGNPILHFERWDYIYDLSNYGLPNISEQAPFPQGFGTNASEVASNYSLTWQQDDSDLNTINHYDGTTCYCTTTLKTDVPTSRLTLVNLTEKNLVFAHAVRKNQETSVEHVFSHIIYPFLAVIYGAIIAIPNAVIDTIDKGIKAANKLGAGLDPIPEIPNPFLNPNFAQVGYLYLSSNLSNQPKAFLAGPTITVGASALPFTGNQITGITVDANNKGTVTQSVPNCSAQSLFKNFHFSNLGLTVNPGPPFTTQAAGTPYFNQYYTFKDQKISLCCADYDLIKNNNIIFVDFGPFAGSQARVDSLKWDTYTGLASIDYRINRPYTNNLQTTFVIDGVKTTKTL